MKNRTQHGFSIAELLVTTAIGLVIFAGIMTFYVSMVITSAESLKAAKLNQYLRSAMDLIVSDIRRAGYWNDDTTNYGSGSGENPNPFMLPENNLSVHDHEDAEDSCILYSYDLDGDGLVGVVSHEEEEEGSIYSSDNNERFGFRMEFDQTQKKSVIKMRRGGEEFNCNSGSWQAITDDIHVIKLTFDLLETPVPATGSPTSDPTIFIRQVTISMTGRLDEASEVTRTISDTVRIRNDRFYAP